MIYLWKIYQHVAVHRCSPLIYLLSGQVETEQIVHDTSYFFLGRTRCSSYVQLRGSVPLFWSQESTKVVVGRPPLELSVSFCYTASCHMIWTNCSQPHMQINHPHVGDSVLSDG